MSRAEAELGDAQRNRSFADFYRMEQAAQVRRAALLTGSSELAHDIVHDSFLEVFRRWGTIDRPGAYLNRSVVNRCRDAARSRHRRGQLVTRLHADESSWDAEPVADLLDGLPFNQRATVVLRFYVGLSNVEIADALGCPPGSVGPWLDRALRHLRKVLP